MAIWDDVIPESEREMFLEKGIFRSGPLPYGIRAAVLVVDMSNAFVTDDYPTGWADTGKPAAKAIAEILTAARAQNIPVIYSTGGKATTLAERGYWKDGRNGLRAEFDQYRHQIYSELQPESGEPVLQKCKPSVFFGTDLAAILVYHQIDTLIVTGMVTSGCVRATVVDAFNLNYVVMIPEECVADRAQVSHKVSLFDMHMKYADVLPQSQVLDYLENLHQTLKTAQPAGALG